MSRNCPQGNTVKSSGNNGKLPGLTNYSIELEPDLIDAEEALEIDSLDLGAINWQASGNIEWIEDEPSWMVYNPNLPRRTSLGDALALMSEYVLDIMQPYPGDCEALGNVGVRQRFSVYRTSNPDWYRINDHLSKNSCVIQTSNLENPNFRLGEWYSRRQSRRLKKVKGLSRLWTMGNAYCHNATLVLCSGIPTLYPCANADMDPEARFHVVPGEPDEYIIYDEEFSCPLRISKSIIMNTHFDLAKWYKARRYPRTPFDKENVNMDLTSLDLCIATDSEPGLEELDGSSLDNWDENDTLSGLSSELTELPPDLVSVTDSDVSAAQSDWDERTYNPIGDVLGETVAQILESSQPYPGDIGHWQLPYSRFEVVRMEDEHYLVEDRLRQSISPLPLPLVRQPLVLTTFYHKIMA